MDKRKYKCLHNLISVYNTQKFLTTEVSVSHWKHGILLRWSEVKVPLPLAFYYLTRSLGVCLGLLLWNSQAINKNCSMNSGKCKEWEIYSPLGFIIISSVAQSCPTLCNLMNRSSTPGLPVHHQLLEITQTHVHWVGGAIQPSHSLLSPSSPAFNLSQHQGLFKWVSSWHQVAKVLEFQLQHQSFQWTPRTDLL